MPSGSFTNSVVKAVVKENQIDLKVVSETVQVKLGVAGPQGPPGGAMIYDPQRTYAPGDDVLFNERTYEARAFANRPAVPIVTPTSGPQNATIAAQPQRLGRTIWSLFKVGGRIFVGYGDYVSNTGPIRITSVSEANPLGAWTDEPVLADTEVISDFRKIGDGRVFALHGDPRGFRGGYAERATNGTWTDKPAAFPNVGGQAPQHIYDLVEFGGSLWACGGRTGPPYAAIWRSQDGGATWTEFFTEASWSFGSFAILGGVLYIYAGGSDVVPASTYRWDGTAWVAAPPYMLGENPPLNGGGQQGHAWRNGWVLGPGSSLANTMYYLDGQGRSIDLNLVTTSWDVGPDGALYILSGDAGYSDILRIAASGPLEPKVIARVQWAPSTVRPTTIMAVSTTRFLLGTDDARLQQVDIPTNRDWESAPPRPLRWHWRKLGDTGFALGQGVVAPGGCWLTVRNGDMRGSGTIEVPAASAFDNRLFGVPLDWLADGVWWFGSLIGCRTTATPPLRAIARVTLVPDNPDGPGLYLDSIAYPEGYVASLPGGSTLRLWMYDLNVPVAVPK